MTKFTYDEQLFSDLHKDARGFRPGATQFNVWNDSTPADKQRIWDNLLNEMDQRFQEEKDAQAQASHDFEFRVQDLMLSGAKDRTMAIKWLHEAFDTNGDTNYLEYHLGLPYGYIK